MANEANVLSQYLAAVQYESTAEEVHRTYHIKVGRQLLHRPHGNTAFGYKMSSGT